MGVNFDEEGNPFPQGSGLSEQDRYVGQVTAMCDDRFGVDYKFQLASDTLSSPRHDLTAISIWINGSSTRCCMQRRLKALTLMKAASKSERLQPMI